MAADLSYQNVVHKRMGGQLFVIPTGCTGVIESGGKLDLADGSTMTISGEVNVASSGVVNFASGAALQIGGTAYIDTSGRVVQQYESKTSANGGETLINYGVSFISPVALASTFILPAGKANVEKRIVIGGNNSTVSGGAAVTIKSSGCVFIDNTSSTALATVTGTAYLPGSIHLIAESTAVWHVIGRPSTTLALT